MRGIQELATVQAHIFEAGDTCGYEQLLASERHLWHFDDTSAETVWDAVTDPDVSGGRATFATRAILFTLYAVPSTQIPPPTDRSRLGNVTSYGQEDLADYFDVIQMRRMVDIALRLNAHLPERRTIVFIGVFDVILTPIVHPIERYAMHLEFLGELDLSTPLPLSTATLEMDILRLMGEGQYLHQHAIMNCLYGQRPRPDMWVLRRAIDNLVRAGLLDLSPDQLPVRYTLSAKGMALRA